MKIKMKSKIEKILSLLFVNLTYKVIVYYYTWKWFSMKTSTLIKFLLYKISLKPLIRRFYTSRWHLKFSQANTSLRGSMVAINQTRSQKKEVFKNKKYYLQATSYEVYILTRAVYKVMNVWTVR